MDFLRKLLFSRVSKAPVLIPACPDCRQPLQLTFTDDIAVSRCASCKGLFIDPDSFEKILSKKQADLSEIEAETCYEKTYRPSTERGCPACQTPMTNFDFRSGVYLDSCPKGHGIWLDGGELELVHRIRQAAGEMTLEERRAMAAAVVASSSRLAQVASEVAEFEREQRSRRLESDDCAYDS